MMSGNRRFTSVPIPAGRVAAVDYGRKRMGIAICDAERIIASPWPMRQPTGDETAEAVFFRRLVAEEAIVGFVVGLPVHADGSDSKMSIEAERFAVWLGETTSRPVTFQDERYTSVEAAGMLAGLGLSRGKKKARADSIAAHIILTAWMEAHASPKPGDGVAPHEPRQRPGALDG
jgi:putative holliday junction resolvase